MSKKNQKITIPFSENDVQELMSEGTEFDWTFETDKGEMIDVHIIREELEDEDND